MSQEKSTISSSSPNRELFDDFFSSGLEESISPFLTKKSRHWGKNLHLKASFVAAFFLSCSFILSFFPTQLPLSHLFLLLTYFFAGVPALIAAVEDIGNLSINIDVLMTLAAFLSIVIGTGKEGALLLVLFSLSGSMEEAVCSKAKGAIYSLKKLSPQKTFVVLPDGTFVERSVKDVLLGSKIHIKPGQVVPLDGIVMEGISTINLVHLTGENYPLVRKEGDAVASGAKNLEGALTLQVTHTSSDSTLARIIQLVTAAQGSKPKLQRWLDQASNGYALAIIAIAGLCALLLPFFFSIPYFGVEGSIYRALAFLIAASPCALIIAIPIAYLSAVSCCAREGILVKGGTILDRLARSSLIAMDKTGTITTGELTYLGRESFGGTEDHLPLAYSMERSSTHPIARALTKHAMELNIPTLQIHNFRSVAGYGLEAFFENTPAYIGNSDWLSPKLPEAMKEAVESKISESKKNGELFTLFVHGPQVTLFRFRDTLRPGIRETLHTLKKKWGMRLVMLTGDHEAGARRIAMDAGITEYYADLRPEDKLAFIASEENLAMIGDGINDAPALARAAVGISMGKAGSSAAIDASDIVLLQDNIERLEWLVKKSRQVVRIVKQNVFLASIAIVFATIPALLGIIPLWLAVILHEGGTVVVGLNALRLLKK